LQLIVQNKTISLLVEIQIFLVLYKQAVGEMLPLINNLYIKGK